MFSAKKKKKKVPAHTSAIVDNEFEKRIGPNISTPLSPPPLRLHRLIREKTTSDCSEIFSGKQESLFKKGRSISLTTFFTGDLDDLCEREKKKYSQQDISVVWTNLSSQDAKKNEGREEEVRLLE